MILRGGGLGRMLGLRVLLSPVRRLDARKGLGGQGYLGYCDLRSRVVLCAMSLIPL